MPRTSKKQLDKESLKEIQEYFSYLISTLHNSPEIENFLNSFLTREEKLMLSKRLVLLMMIRQGYKTPIIQQVLQVSYETVRSYTTFFSLANPQFHQTIERLVRREKTKEFWEKVDQILKPLDLALRAKSDMQARAKFASGDWE